MTTFQMKKTTYRSAIPALVDQDRTIMHPKGVLVLKTDISADTAGDRFVKANTILEKQSGGNYKPITSGNVDAKKEYVMSTEEINVKDGDQSTSAALFGAVYKDRIIPTDLTTTDLGNIKNLHFI